MPKSSPFSSAVLLLFVSNFHFTSAFPRPNSDFQHNINDGVCIQYSDETLCPSLTNKSPTGTITPVPVPQTQRQELVKEKRQNEFEALAPPHPFDSLLPLVFTPGEVVKPDLLVGQEVGKLKSALRKFLDGAKELVGVVEGWLGAEGGDESVTAVSGSGEEVESTTETEVSFPGTTPRIHMHFTGIAGQGSWVNDWGNTNIDKATFWEPGEVAVQTLDLGTDDTVIKTPEPTTTSNWGFETGVLGIGKLRNQTSITEPWTTVRTTSTTTSTLFITHTAPKHTGTLGTGADGVRTVDNLDPLRYLQIPSPTFTSSATRSNNRKLPIPPDGFYTSLKSASLEEQLPTTTSGSFPILPSSFTIHIPIPINTSRPPIHIPIPVVTPPSSVPIPTLSPLVPLSPLCSNKTIKTLSLPLLSRFYGRNAYPSLHQFPGCSPPNPSQARFAPGLLNCTALGTEVQKCQDQGVRILLSIRSDGGAGVGGDLHYGEERSETEKAKGPFGKKFSAHLSGLNWNGSATSEKSGIAEKEKVVPNLFDPEHRPSALALTLFSLFGNGKTERADLRPLGPDHSEGSDVVKWLERPLGEEVVLDGFEVLVRGEWKGMVQGELWEEFIKNLRDLGDFRDTEEASKGEDRKGVVVSGWVQ